MQEKKELSAAALFGIDFARELLANKKTMVLTGAGISTDSGIPDYRGEGRIARHPMTYDVFMGSPEARVRYWARSFIGWNRISEALPNPGHRALTKAEATGKIFQVVTQNVDQLHQKAGTVNVVDLHGRLDMVKCMKCLKLVSRAEIDELLTLMNPTVSKSGDFEFTPDGDAEIEVSSNFIVPSCQSCDGILKPDVVFFGESVPSATVEMAMNHLDDAEVLLVVGTSLSVNSGLRFARRAAKAKKPIVIVNLGATKADELASAKINANTSLVLESLLND